jgi:hypothetical protein
MTKPLVRDHDLSTGEIVEREMTNDEYAQLQTDLAKQAERDAEATAKEAAREAVLTKLGLTAEEVAALLS